MSGGNNNVTISGPGPKWDMLWTSQFDNFQLDIVGFLAILGEASVLSNAQVAALSRLFYLPRLLPAPQALLRVARPESLPTEPASVTAVSTGNTKEHVQHIAHVLLGNKMERNTVRCVKIEKVDLEEKRTPSWSDVWFRGLKKGKESSVKAKASGPLAYVTILGFILALALFLTSFLLGDGMSLVATILLSFLSTLVGVANKWDLNLAVPANKDKEKRGDVVIRYPNGSFLVVRCNDWVARELFFAPEQIQYTIQNPSVYMMISLLGTLMLMLGVICLANARLELQLGWAAAYIILNVAHWAAAAVPPRLHWDLDCYSLKEEIMNIPPTSENFTEALWKTIALTKEIRWIENGKAAPRTDVWDLWLHDAKKASQDCRIDEWQGKEIPEHGRLDNLFWPERTDSDKFPRPMTVWNVPKWGAKKEWDNLNEQQISETEKGQASSVTVALPVTPDQAHLS